MILLALMVAELSFAGVVAQRFEVDLDVEVLVAFWKALSYLLTDCLQFVAHWVC